MRHPLSDSLSFLWGLKIWNSLLAGNAAWKSPAELCLMINLLPIAERLSEADGEKVGRSLFTRVSGAFSQTAGQVFSSSLVRSICSCPQDTNVGECWAPTQDVSELHVLKWHKNLHRRVRKFDTADESRSEEMGRGASDVSNLWLKLIWLFVIGSVKHFCRKSGRSRLQIKQEDQNSTET